MDYEIEITRKAHEDLDEFIDYLVNVKKNSQAASNLLKDYQKTQEKLKLVAGGLQLCIHPTLRLLGYRKMKFLKHDYYMLYRLVENKAFVDRIFHGRQDYVTHLLEYISE